MHGIFQARNIRDGCHFLLQGIFLIQGQNLCLLCLLHYRQVLYLLSHLGSVKLHKIEFLGGDMHVLFLILLTEGVGERLLTIIPCRKGDAYNKNQYHMTWWENTYRRPSNFIWTRHGKRTWVSQSGERMRRSAEFYITYFNC